MRWLYNIVIWLASVSTFGYVFMKLWNWFMAPLGIVPVSFWWSMGISVIIGISLTGIAAMMPKPEQPYAVRGTVVTIYYWFLLLVGWTFQNLAF